MPNESGGDPLKPEDTVVTELESGWRELVKKEDYWAIWLGFALIIIGMIIYLPRPPEGMQETVDKANAAMEAEAGKPFKTVAWYEASDSKTRLKAASESHGKTVAKLVGFPHGWKDNPLDSLFMFEEEAAEKKASAQAKYDLAKTSTSLTLAAAQAAEDAAKDRNFDDNGLNAEAKAAIGKWRTARGVESKARKKVKSATAFNQIGPLVGLGIFFAVFFGIGIQFMGQSVGRFVVGFAFVFLLAVLAYMFHYQSDIKHYGIGYAAWAIVFGLLVSNTIGTPNWVKPAVQTEYFIKAGLVLLGAEILFGKIVLIGVPGIFVAWIVTPVVLILTYIFGQKVLKIPSKTLNITVSADMSVCGVSAAIATAAACRAKKEELTLAVGMSLVFTSIMMIVMPNIIKAAAATSFGANPLDPGLQVIGGAWMGGTIDATGAVAAAGEFLGDKALYVAATIKMIQNVLIGVIAFCVAVYWVVRVDRDRERTVGAMEIWYRFPKFVLGFLAASIIFSAIYASMGSDVGYTMIDNGVIRGFTKAFRGWFFCLAFVSIGLATNFRELAVYFKGGKPLVLYLCGQTFNLILTLTMAYVMFYIVFNDITASL
jgi:uncharacterized membrane protein YadS